MCWTSEKFKFKVKFDTDLGGHPRTPRSPCTVITLRGRTLLKEALLLYESCGEYSRPRLLCRARLASASWQVAVSTVICEAAPHPPGRGLQEERLGADFFNFYCFEAERPRLEDPSCQRRPKITPKFYQMLSTLLANFVNVRVYRRAQQHAGSIEHSLMLTKGDY